MIQSHRFIINESERIRGLKDILLDLLPSKNIETAPRGSVRTSEGDIDTAEFAFFQRDEQVGTFEYMLMEGVYDCSLDLHGTPRETYEEIMNVLKERFPEIK